MQAQWKFRVMSRGEMNTDPIEGEFFSTDHLDSMTDALVRETIQNSLDAGMPGGQVSVRFRMLRPRAGASPLFDRYLATLKPHLHAEQNGLSFRPTGDEPLHCLLIEDYGTRGLEGDDRQDNDLEERGRKNDFFYFWRNVGRSGKSEEDRGRWGLGKTVFQAASRINSFMGVTVRASDGRALLMGQSVLKTHMLERKKHYPYGWYGVFEGDFALPVTDRAGLERFCEDFSIDRLGKAGLSLVIPYPDMTIRYRRIVGSVLVHYFLPIISGDLTVEVDVDQRRSLITAGTIDAHIDSADFERTRLRAQNLKALFDFARWAIGQRREGYSDLKMPDQEKAPEWSEALFDEQTLDALRLKFDRGERIALRVPMTVQQKHRPARETWFSLFLERDEGLDGSEDHFIREGITIAGVKSLKQRGIRAIVAVDDKVLSTMLGDAENPAHTEWQERSPKFRGKYVRGASCLRFVKNSPRELLRLVSTPTQGRDEAMLRDIFYVEVPTRGEAAVREPEPGGKPGLSAEKPEAVGGPGQRFFHMTPVRGGFRIIGDKSTRPPQPFFLVTAAYVIRRGDPFSRFSTFDFEVDKMPIRVRVKDLKVHRLLRNQIVAEVTGDEFILEVTGFDPHRDLIVKTEVIDGTAR